MVKNKFLIAITLYLGLFSHTSFSAQQPTRWQDWAYNKGAALWQAGSEKLSQTKNYVTSLLPQSVVNTINQWTTTKKIAVMTAIVGALAVLYNKDVILQMASDAYDKSSNLRSTQSTKSLTKNYNTTRSNHEGPTPTELAGLTVGTAGLGVAVHYSNERIKNNTIKEMNNLFLQNPNMSLDEKIDLIYTKLEELKSSPISDPRRIALLEMRNKLSDDIKRIETDIIAHINDLFLKKANMTVDEKMKLIKRELSAIDIIWENSSPKNNSNWNKYSYKKEVLLKILKELKQQSNLKAITETE